MPATPSLDTIPHQITEDGKTRWVFPASWPAEECLAFEALARDVAADEERIEALDEAAFAPSAIIAAKRLEAAEKKAERIRRERDAEEDVIYAAAVKEHGGEHRVARVRTVEGSIMLRPQTLPEVDRLGERIGADGLKPKERLALARDALKSTAFHPAPARFDVIVGLYPGVWTELYTARDALTSGLVEDAEKKA